MGDDMENKNNNKYKYQHKKYNQHNYYKKAKKKNFDKNILLSEKNNSNKLAENIEVTLKSNLNEEKSSTLSSRISMIKIALGIIVLVAIVFGVSYSYFNYYQEVSKQADISAGEVYVRVPEEKANITLNKLYPREDAVARSQNDNYIDFTINAKNTSPTRVLKYTININDGTPVANKVRISKEYIKIDLQEKINNEYTYILEGVGLNEFTFSGVVPVNTTNELTRQFRLRLWVSDDVLISDTEPDATFTQSEFANLYASYHIKVNSHDESVICRRATVLHTETCTQSSDYCYGDGYYLGGTMNTTTITYGNLGTRGSTPATGDAFDCNVDGTGYNERFYYVSPYYNTDTKTFDDTTGYATLIYYSNTVNSVANVGGSAYATQADLQVAYPSETFTSYDNWHGPVTAVTHLPSTSQWSNITLKTTTRAILAEDQTTHDSTTTTGGTLPTAFSYSGRAARLLTAQELMNGCNLTKVGRQITGELSGCNFLFEGTQYADSSKALAGSWLETPRKDRSYNVWYEDVYKRRVDYYDANYINVGARPVIDVSFSKIQY